MKEIELDKFIGKKVMLKDFEKECVIGRLEKITNYKTKDGDYHRINNGYCLYCRNKRIDYRKSHIKNIVELWD